MEDSGQGMRSMQDIFVGETNASSAFYRTCRRHDLFIDNIKQGKHGHGVDMCAECVCGLRKLL